jgi:hypothetical protein
MSHNVTSEKLKQRQIKAAHLLAQGCSTIEVAKKLKLRRETLTRWKQIPRFRVEYQLVALSVREDLRQRLVRLADTAIGRIMAELDEPLCFTGKEVKASLDVLKLLGIGPETVQINMLPRHYEIYTDENSYENTRSNSALSALSTAPSDASTPSAASDVTP